MAVDISSETVQSPQMLLKILRKMSTLINELRTDHGTFRTSVGNIETLIEEMHDDHATSRAALASVIASLQGDYILTPPTLAIGSTTTAVSNIAFYYIINGVPYLKAAVEAGTAPGDDVIPQETFGAVAFDIGTDGTIDAIEAADNATGYASAELAAAGLPAVAADHARMGYVTASKSDGDFTFGTTDLNAANTTVAYTDGTSCFAAISGAAPAALAASKPASPPAAISAAAIDVSK